MGRAVYDARRPLRARGRAQVPVPLQPAATLAGQKIVARLKDALQLRLDQRHHRRKQRFADREPAGRDGRPHLRRKHRVARRQLHLRRVGQPLHLGGLARHARSHAQDVRRHRPRRRVDRADQVTNRGPTELTLPARHVKPKTAVATTPQPPSFYLRNVLHRAISGFFCRRSVV